MSFNPIGFVFPKNKISEGGAGYTEVVDVPATTAISLEIQNGKSYTAMGNIIVNGEMTLGKLYRVRTDSGEYVAECKQSGADEKYRYLGNRSIYFANGENTGENFLFSGYYVSDLGIWGGTFYDANRGTSAQIFEYEKVEKVNPIDPKYLPEGGFGYMSKEETIVVSELSLTQANINAEMGTWIIDFVPVLGETYKVTLDSVDYQLTAIKLSEVVPELSSVDGVAMFSEDEGFGFMYFADPSLIGYGDFLTASQSALQFTSETAMATDHTLSIVGSVYVPKTIDPKYLPGAVLPVVTITTVPTAEGAELTAEESAAMDAVAALGVPAVIKFADSQGINASGVFLYQWIDGIVQMYSTPIFGETIVNYVFMHMEGEAWKFMTTITEV